MCCILHYVTNKNEFYANLLGESLYNHGPSYVIFLTIIVKRHRIDLKLKV